MHYDANENRKSIPLVSIIAIILAGLLVVGAMILQNQSNLISVDKIAKSNQEVIVAEQDKNEEKQKENKQINSNQIENKKEEQKVVQQTPQTQPPEPKVVENTTQVQEQNNTQQQLQDAGQQQNQNQTQPAVVPTQPVQTTTPVSSEQSYGKIFLTFDDGPSNSTTGRLLDILKKYKVKATFFVTGNGSDDLIKREYAEGHSIGLHTYSHSYKTVYASEEAFFDDLNKVDQRVYNAIGIHPKITRFPGGASNTVSKFNPGIMTRLASQLKD